MGFFATANAVPIEVRETRDGEVAAWENGRDAAVMADWMLTTEDGRTKLERLYPPIERQ